MKILKKAAFSVAAASMVIAPVAASSVPVFAADRIATASQDADEMGGGTGLIAILAAAALVAGVIIAADGGDSEPVVTPPVSP